MENCLPYLLYFAFFIFLTFDLKSTSKEGIVYTYDKEKLFTIFIVFLVFFGLRGFISTDWVNYYKYYEKLDRSSFFIHNYFIQDKNYLNYEKGFEIFAKLTKSISNNYFVFQFLNTFIDVLVLIHFFRKYQKKYISLCFIFYFLFGGAEIEINLLRNSKSILLFLISLEYIQEKKIIKYIMLNLIGCLFHVSSILYIFIIPIFFINLSDKFLRIFFTCGILIYLLRISILSGIIKFLLTFSYSGRFAELVWGYLINEASSRLSIGFIERIFTLIVFMVFKNKIIKDDPKLEVFYRVYYIFFFMHFYCSDIIILPARCAKLFFSAYWILYPEIYSKLRVEWKKIYLSLLVIYGVLLIFVTYSPAIFRYDFCFNEINTYDDKAIIVNKLLYN